MAGHVSGHISFLIRVIRQIRGQKSFVLNEFVQGNDVGQFGQLQTRKNTTKDGTWPTLPTLFSTSVSLFWWGSKTRSHPTRQRD